ncbi:Cytochrome P450 705A5 [Arabidopsis thaliana]|jgi:cytochrome P450|uniref:Cytochrome P450 705A5 n=3 Tax=Arabidopsis TaxID=3701 RepID=THAD_ARATH|nr:cytochrome P450, family 705, subfamily A, polypeptide 5 [Arabidopsis thaliana]Q9FI39.1 RecName: Full=Cytochrome P450 705A5; AltName: Full=Thalian-diol desaturase; Short=AtTHAD [Arabidopsis thaliana]KAG7605311.1 Cytochrome P450 [Arabidopsis thaliana x Arabidopsis arenosa]AED95603.1 cytochrome P450, family 705, subfamily A, polypeptide 5 [Arabidopsis thaliana]OAO92823.1 THAD1 [Arabidopsis thaliana]CAD5334279.1 unnamed protein product [Arabidopsis thaliana]BAB11063.1 cytochrome P450 [Arabidop|eukprot:NP_199610.1 cytochrome P450, family 705, subfamily A, polypeptide 5 [Arabidopsis thaliana]
MASMITVDFENCFIFLLLCLFSRLSYDLFFRKTKDSRAGCALPPSPPSLPIIGHLHLILFVPIHQSFKNISSKYGPLLHLRFFNFPIVLVSSASTAYEIFKAQDVNVSSRPPPPIEESLILGSSSFINTPYGDYSKFMKKFMVQKLLGPQALQRSRNIRADELERFYKTLLDKAMKKQTVEIRNEAMKLTNNTICKMIMGRSCSEENGEAETVRGLVTESIFLTKKHFLGAMFHKPLKKLGISLFAKELMNVSNRFDELLEKILVEHEEKLQEHHQTSDMLDMLLEAYGDENAEYKITRDQIKSLFVDLFSAGTEASANTIQWTMAEIIKNPKICERLREEIDSVVGKTRLVQETDLPNLPYLQAIVKEGLRLHPPGPVVRTFKETCEIKGFYIPEKTRLFVNVYAIMRDPDFWEDPEEFKPERFLASSRLGEEDEKREDMLKYIPFGSGRRACPGSHLAYTVVGSVIGMMVQHFDWIIKGEKINMKEGGTMTLTMAHPLKCTPVPRNLNT